MLDKRHGPSIFLKALKEGATEFRSTEMEGRRSVLTRIAEAQECKLSEHKQTCDVVRVNRTYRGFI